RTGLLAHFSQLTAELREVKSSHDYDNRCGDREKRQFGLLCHCFSLRQTKSEMPIRGLHRAPAALGVPLTDSPTAKNAGPSGVALASRDTRSQPPGADTRNLGL